MHVSNARVFAAELIGTAVLMIGGVGTAVLAGGQVGALGIALAFGLSYLVMAYAVGHVSGCHINPAVTLGLVLTRKMEIGRAVYYWVGQLLGGIVGATVVYAIANNLETFSSTNNFAQNGWDSHSPGGYGFGAAMFAEIVFAALLVFVILSSTNRRFPASLAGAAAGLTYAIVFLVTQQVDGGSANPARSLGSAIFAGSDALSQVWLFIVFPLIGGAVGALVWLIVDEARLEDTMLGGAPDNLRDASAVDVVDEELSPRPPV
jgi:aquaporin Z